MVIYIDKWYIIVRWLFRRGTESCAVAKRQCTTERGKGQSVQEARRCAVGRDRKKRRKDAKAIIRTARYTCAGTSTGAKKRKVEQMPGQQGIGEIACPRKSMDCRGAAGSSKPSRRRKSEEGVLSAEQTAQPRREACPPADADKTGAAPAHTYPHTTCAETDIAAVYLVRRVLFNITPTPGGRDRETR
jgi:hypothetical protein